MRKLLFVMVCIAFGASNSFADQSAKSSRPANNMSSVKSGGIITHRGTNPPKVGGAAKSAGNINGASVRLRR